MSRFGTLFAQGLGQQVELQQQNAERKAALEQSQALAALRRQEVEQNAADIAERKRQQQVSRDIGGFLSQASQSDAQEVMDPLKSAKAFNDAAILAYSKGSPDLATKLEAQAKQKTLEAKEIAQTKVLEQKQRAEALADTASNFMLNPTAEGAASLARAAVAAGQNPLEIPAPGTPAFARWAKQQSMASMSAKEQLAASEKQREFDAQQERLKSEHADRERGHAEDRRLRAEIAHGNQELRKELLDLRKGQEERKASAPSKQTATERSSAMQLSEAAGQFGRQWENLQAAGPSTTLGAFANMPVGTSITESLAKLGGTRVTSDQANLEKVNATGMAKALLSGMQAVMKGRAPTDAQIKSFQESLTPVAGESSLIALYKNVNAAEEMKTLLERANPYLSPAQREANEADIKRFTLPITTKQIMDFTRSKEGATGVKKLLKAHESLTSAIGDAESYMKQPSSTSTPSPSLPAGWSVKEH